MTMTAKYAGKCSACGCRISAGSLIDWTKGIGARHANPTLCAEAKAAAVVAPKPSGVTLDATKIVGFLQAARDKGLKFPKVRFADKHGREILLVLAGATSRNPGAVYVKLQGEYLGLIAPSGDVRGTLTREADVLALLAIVATDPATAAKTYGMLTGNCSFCGRTLTDEGSVEVGYGPICAGKYGLPHTPKGSAKIVALVDVPLLHAPVVDEIEKALGGIDGLGIDEGAHDVAEIEAAQALYHEGLGWTRTPLGW